MQLATITMATEEAQERLSHYQTRLRDERTRQDEQIAAGYRALARGLPVIQLSSSIGAGGFFPDGRPRIAIARADATDCWVDYDDGRQYVYSTEEPSWRNPTRNRGALVNPLTVRVQIPADDYLDVDWRTRQRRGHTIMPIIPPDIRPRRRRLHLFHILWEVEKWDDVPPRDPALLRWIGGDLWAVHATWDLTELERAVLAR